MWRITTITHFAILNFQTKKLDTLVTISEAQQIWALEDAIPASIPGKIILGI